MSTFLWLSACTVPDEDTAAPREEDGPHVRATVDEGEDENDPDSGDRDTGLDDIDPDPTDEVLCFPGADRSFDTCLDLVAWSSDWGEDYDYPESSDPRYRPPLRFVDLDAVDPGLELAPNFVVEEFMQAWKGRFGVFLGGAVEHLQAIRDSIDEPLYINSGYRNVTYNAGVGGVEFSRHQWGDAADMRADGTSLTSLGALCAAEGAGYVGYYESHVHCDWRDDPLDPAAYGPEPDGDRSAPAHEVRLVEVDGVWTAPATGFDEGEPLRVWTGRDASGAVIERVTGRTYTPGAVVTSIEVLVGGQVGARAGR